jgi:CO/xanthine dehydrogenase Mo-binding subunit
MAKATGKPVQVAWTRREEFLYDRLRPAAVVKIKSGITGDGKISLWDYNVYFAGSRGSANFYDLPHHQILSWDVARGAASPHPFFTGAWRAPGNNTNTFARESQIDIMAARAGIDPVEFRLMNLKDEKMINILKTAAGKFGWTPAAHPSGKGYGVSCGIDAGTSVAAMAEVEVNKTTGYVKVKRVTVVQDMGMVVNPQGATLQVESCVVMGLGYALTEDIEFEGGNMLTRNFDTYEFTRFSWVPEIEVVLIDAQDQPPQGGGEPAIINMGAVVANAIFDATGARLFSMPMNRGRVLEALKT